MCVRGLDASAPTDQETPVITANVRARLSREDAQLAVRLVARGSGQAVDEAEERLRDEGVDALLDDPRLLDALMDSRQGMHASLPLFCYVVVRQTLRSAGEDDRVLADYVAAIILEFGLRQRAQQLRTHDDATYDTLASIAGEVDDESTERGFLARAHLGNYALWMSGLFPDTIERRRWRRGGPDLDYFEEMGQRGFRLAAEHHVARARGLGPVLLLAGERFPMLRLALNRVSDRLFFPNIHTPERLMRQVRDEARWRLAS